MYSSSVGLSWRPLLGQLEGHPLICPLPLSPERRHILTSHFCPWGTIGPSCPLIPVLADFLDFADIMPLICWLKGQDRQCVERPTSLLKEAQPLPVGAAAEIPIVLHHPELGHLNHQGFLGVWSCKEPAHRQQAVLSPLLGDVAEKCGIFPLQVVNHGPRGHGDIEGSTDLCREKRKEENEEGHLHFPGEYTQHLLSRSQSDVHGQRGGPPPPLLCSLCLQEGALLGAWSESLWAPTSSTYEMIPCKWDVTDHLA